MVTRSFPGLLSAHAHNTEDKEQGTRNQGEVCIWGSVYCGFNSQTSLFSHTLYINMRNVYTSICTRLIYIETKIAQVWTWGQIWVLFSLSVTSLSFWLSEKDSVWRDFRVFTSFQYGEISAFFENFSFSFDMWAHTHCLPWRPHRGNTSIVRQPRVSFTMTSYLFKNLLL